jgi:hypothetical protein
MIVHSLVVGDEIRENVRAIMNVTVVSYRISRMNEEKFSIGSSKSFLIKINTFLRY